MRRLLMSISIAGTFAGAALANDTMDAMIGASVVYTYQDGSSVTAQFFSNGTYTTDSAGGGSWTIDGDELCITTDNGDSGCTTLAPGHSVGDSWEGVDAFGNPVTITIE